MMRPIALSTAMLSALALAPSTAPKSAVQDKNTQQEILVPAGTTFHVRLDRTLETGRNRAGDRFTATLSAPVLSGGKVAIPRGTRLHGHVTGAQPSGRLRGRGHLEATLDSFALRGTTYRVHTSVPSRVTDSHKKRNLAWIGGGSGGGALIGGLAAGGPWALAGAGIGAGAGTATAALTGKKQVVIPAESPMNFSLRAPLRIRSAS